MGRDFDLRDLFKPHLYLFVPCKMFCLSTYNLYVNQNFLQSVERPSYEFSPTAQDLKVVVFKGKLLTLFVPLFSLFLLSKIMCSLCLYMAASYSCPESRSSERWRILYV